MYTEEELETLSRSTKFKLDSIGLIFDLLREKAGSDRAIVFMEAAGIDPKDMFASGIGTGERKLS